MCFSEDELPFVTKTGIYPYEYTDSLDKWQETELPSKEKFYNSMTNSNVTDSNYDHAKTVWSMFNCET